MDTIRPVARSRLTDSSNLSEHIPYGRFDEMYLFKKEVKEAGHMFAVFDGTTNVDEEFGIDFRWNREFKIVQIKIGSLTLLGKVCFCFSHQLIGAWCVTVFNVFVYEVV